MQNVSMEIACYIYSYLDFKSQHTAARVSTLFLACKKIIHVKILAYAEARANFLIERLASPALWKEALWIKLDNFKEKYDKLYFPITSSGFKVLELLEMRDDIFLIEYKTYIWNKKLGPPEDKYFKCFESSPRNFEEL